MPTQQLPPYVRFAHGMNTLNTSKCPYSGLTICYVRDDDKVIFTYALCSKDDEYNKKIGRDTTIATWTSVANKMNAADSTNNISGDAYVNIKERFGYVGVGILFDSIAGTNVFADQFENKITMHDFKHAYISSILIEIVIHTAVMTKYPDCNV